jgi:imidazole glycerol-phosphate synthase subunit HisF
MLKTRVVPCLLLKGQGLVKTIKFKNPTYIGDPINAIKIFNDKEVDELVFLDITATSEKRRPNFKLLSEIAGECFMPLGYGGGINSLEDIEQLFNIGIEKVIINTAAFANINLITEASKIFGSQSIVVSVDVKKNWWRKKYSVFTHSGKNNTGIHPVEYAKRIEDAGAGEIILNSIDMDGTMLGYDLALIKNVSKEVSIPVIALGGAGSIQDFGYAVKAGASAVAAGSFFVFQKAHRAVLITYPTQKEMDAIFG